MKVFRLGDPVDMQRILDFGALRISEFGIGDAELGTYGLFLAVQN